MNRSHFTSQGQLPKRATIEMFVVGDRVKNKPVEPNSTLKFGDPMAAMFNNKRGTIIYIENDICIIKWDGPTWSTTRYGTKALLHE